MVGAISARFPGLAWPIALPAEGRLGLLAQQIVGAPQLPWAFEG
jgi:hypothetical protein